MVVSRGWVCELNLQLLSGGEVVLPPTQRSTLAAGAPFAAPQLLRRAVSIRVLLGVRTTRNCMCLPGCTVVSDAATIRAQLVRAPHPL